MPEKTNYRTFLALSRAVFGHLDNENGLRQWVVGIAARNKDRWIRIQRHVSQPSYYEVVAPVELPEGVTAWGRYDYRHDVESQMRRAFFADRVVYLRMGWSHGTYELLTEGH